MWLVVKLTEEMKKLEYILNYFGIESQLDKLTEEANEVFKAGIIFEASGYNKELTKRGRRNHIIEEIADLEIVLDQIRLNYEITIDEEDHWRKQKLDRTINRIKTGYYEEDKNKYNSL